MIKAQRHRTQERNLADALARLQEMVDAAAHVTSRAQADAPAKGSQRRRVDSKVKRGKVKEARRKMGSEP